MRPTKTVGMALTIYGIVIKVPRIDCGRGGALTLLERIGNLGMIARVRVRIPQMWGKILGRKEKRWKKVAQLSVKVRRMTNRRIAGVL